MQDKTPLAHYSGVLSEAVHESAAANLPTFGAAALSEYLKTCEQHAIVPDVGGAFASAFAAGFNLAASQVAPAAATLPDERDAFETKFPVPPDCVRCGTGYASTSYNGWRANDHVSRWDGWQARAALAATPAAAAPVVLPEPDFRLKWHNGDARYTVNKPNIGDTDCYTADTVRALLATATGLPAQATWLQPKDLEALQRFEETASDNQGHDIGKAAVARLTGFGCLQSHGFGTYSITDFGHFVLDDWEHARALPFRTQADRDADQRATIAAAKGEGQ